MATYITIDGGTTNTRLHLVCEYKITDTVKYGVGAQKGCQNQSLIKEAIRDGIQLLLQRNGLLETDIERILASGMITSEGGLCALDHLVAPCGIRELSEGLYSAVFADIATIPFVFVRGVKTGGTDFTKIDMMRGEETELMGMGEGIAPDSLYVLPGSHSKLVHTDREGRISDFSTELTGELISAVAGGTILQNSVSLDGHDICETFLQTGYTYAKAHGVNAAFFKVRILDKLLGRSPKEVYSFFMGAALQPEVDNIIKSPSQNVIVGGKRALQAPLTALLQENSDKTVTAVAEEMAETATAYGAIRIFEYGKEKGNGKAI